MFEFDTKISLESLPTVSEFVQYLRFANWKKIEQDNHNLFVFGTKQFDEKGIIVKIPINDSFSDTKLIVLRAIQHIAQVRNIDESEVLYEVFRYDCDIWRQKIILSEKQEMYGIPLDTMHKFLKNICDVIKNSEQLEINNPYSKTKKESKNNKTKQKNNIIEKCLFCHTFKGSFGISIEMPIYGEILKKTFPYDKIQTTERKIMERIAIGLSDTANATFSSDFNAIIENSENGFNQKMCASLRSAMTLFQLTKNSEFENTEIEFSFKWSPIVPVSSKVPLFEKIKLLPQKTIQVLKSAEKKMEELEQSNLVTITGEIIIMKDDSNKEDKNRHKVKIKCDNHQKFPDVKLSLSEDQFQQVCLIRGKGKFISVTGSIRNKSGGYYLDNIQKMKEKEPKNSLLYFADTLHQNDSEYQLK
jgi:hypothetical protein